jgi:hypothetical protein
VIPSIEYDFCTTSDHGRSRVATGDKSGVPW